MGKQQFSHQHRSGFTIIEVLVVTVVFAIGLLMLTTLFGSLQRAQRDANYLTIATQAARAEIEKIRTARFSTVANGESFTSSLPSTLPSGSTGTIAVSIPANAPNSKQIEATVNYPIGSTTKTVTVSAYVDPSVTP